MQLEDYFDFLAENDIRLKGTRVGIETVLHDFLYWKRSPEEIAQSYPTLTPEQVYATILYYLHNQEVMTQYLNEWQENNRKLREVQRLNPSPAALRLRQFKAEQTAMKSGA
ncbi:MAG: DUF433 domain-containing protein [Leptolyngbyaceae cyanobacterium SM1_3_5]|nr:DUF433 domain-containing protein [Leptolyngbyaceae cyanobacterium SM1_3_5]